VLVVGLPGGIGSGKSTLADAFAALGVPVIDADLVARGCVAPGSAGLAAVAARFGPDVLLPDGSLDRGALAAIVFADVAARRDLEVITHPCIREGIDRALARLRELPAPPELVVVEHPLLVESGAHLRVDRVVVVEAPLEQRLRRLVADRGMVEDDARARIAAQVEPQQQHLGAVDGGQGALIVRGGGARKTIGGALGPIQAVARARAAGVLAPQRAGAAFGLEGSGAGDAAGVDGFAARLGVQQVHADQLDPAQILALARLVEQFAKVSAELEHGRLACIPGSGRRLRPCGVPSKRDAVCPVRLGFSPGSRQSRLQPRSGARSRQRCRAARDAGVPALIALRFLA
jgi:dephospho-CoA kinase